MKLDHCNRASCVQIIEALQAKLWNHNHGTAMMCADAAIGAAKDWEKEVETLRAQVALLRETLDTWGTHTSDEKCPVCEALEATK